MSTKNMIESAVEHLRVGASVKTVYGEPVVVDGKTIIPVAKVAYGFGGGAANRVPEVAEGEARPSGDGHERHEGGEGAGGGIAAKPVGVVEISGTETKFVPFARSKRLTVAALIGSGAGLALGWFLGARRN